MGLVFCCSLIGLFHLIPKQDTREGSYPFTGCLITDGMNMK